MMRRSRSVGSGIGDEVDEFVRLKGQILDVERPMLGRRPEIGLTLRQGRPYESALLVGRRTALDIPLDA